MINDLITLGIGPGSDIPTFLTFGLEIEQGGVIDVSINLASTFDTDDALSSIFDVTDDLASTIP